MGKSFKDSRIPKQRMHNPAGGGFKPSEQVHKHRKDKQYKSVEDKIVATGKMTLDDIRRLIDEECEE